MSKTVLRYFFDFLGGQEKWLNKMAGRGYRLKKCGRISYVFEKCKPNEYEYAIEFVGAQSYSKAKDYRKYLESLGFRTFTKSINLNFSYGKVRWRPYAKGMGQIATSPGGFNQELFILEKKKDGDPFELHTDVRDKLNTYRTVRRAYAWSVFLTLVLIAVTFFPDGSSMSPAAIRIFRVIAAAFGVLFMIPTVKYSLLIGKLKEQSRIFE